MSALPSTGQIAFTAINTTLGRSTRNQLALSDAQNRTLTGVATGQIKFSNFYGKSLVVSGAIFELLFGTASLPTSDTYGAAISRSGSAPTIVNDATRGYVMNTVGSRFLFTNASFNLPPSYTKMAWIYSLVANQVNGNILSVNNGGNGLHYFWYANGTQLSAGHSSGGDIIPYVTDPNVVPVNTWIHYAVTYDNATRTMTLYRNGSNVSSTTNSALSWSGSILKLGVGNFFGGFVFNGYIDNVRVYNRALTAGEIATVYAG